MLGSRPFLLSISAICINGFILRLFGAGSVITAGFLLITMISAGLYLAKQIKSSKSKISQEILVTAGLAMLCLATFMIINSNFVLMPLAETFSQFLAVIGGSLILLSAFLKGGMAE
jgi:hypothetical protein